MDETTPESSKGQQIVTFDEIFDNEDYVVCDYSLNGAKGSRGFSYTLYDVHRFSELDLVPIKENLEFTNVLLNILQDGKAVTTEGISLEMLSSLSILSEKVKFLSKKEKTIRRKKDKRIRLEDNCCFEKAILNETYDLFRNLYLESRRRVFHPNQKPLYDFLEKITRSVYVASGSAGKRANIIISDPKKSLVELALERVKSQSERFQSIYS